MSPARLAGEGTVPNPAKKGCAEVTWRAAVTRELIPAPPWFRLALASPTEERRAGEAAVAVPRAKHRAGLWLGPAQEGPAVVKEL